MNKSRAPRGWGEGRRETAVRTALCFRNQRASARALTGAVRAASARRRRIVASTSKLGQFTRHIRAQCREPRGWGSSFSVPAPLIQPDRALGVPPMAIGMEIAHDPGET